MFQRILVPVDGSPTAARGLAQAISMAKMTGGTIRAMHVAEQPYMVMGIDGLAFGAAELFEIVEETGRQILADAGARVRETGVPCETVSASSVDGPICDLVSKEATDWKADLIVIGTHGRRGINRLFLGSDAERILRLAPVPVLLVRDAEPAEVA